MTPCHCRVSHKPDQGEYGDCVRACVASLLDYADPEKVPHFFHDNDPPAGNLRMRDWLGGQGYAPFFVHYDGSIALDDVLAMMGDNNPASHFMIVGSNGGGNHAVIGKGGAIVHNPCWFGGSLTGPSSDGVWSIMVIARV